MTSIAQIVMSRDRGVAGMNKNPKIPVDRFWINIALKLQHLQLKNSLTLDMNQALDDAEALQLASCGPEEFPDFCHFCGESTDESVNVVRDYIDVFNGTGPATEVSYHCKICDSMIAYWAYGYWERQI